MSFNVTITGTMVLPHSCLTFIVGLSCTMGTVTTVVLVSGTLVALLIRFFQVRTFTFEVGPFHHNCSKHQKASHPTFFLVQGGSTLHFTGCGKIFANLGSDWETGPSEVGPQQPFTLNVFIAPSALMVLEIGPTGVTLPGHPRP